MKWGGLAPFGGYPIQFSMGHTLAKAGVVVGSGFFV